MKRLTHKAVIKRLKLLNWAWVDPNKYQSLRLSNNIKLQCTKCGYTNNFHIKYMLNMKATCPNCTEGRRPRSRTNEHVAEIGSIKGFKLISKIYKDGITPLKWKCLKCNSIIKLSSNLMSLRILKYCDECKDTKLKRNLKDQFIKAIKLKGGKVVSNFEYINSKQKVLVICDQGHKFKTCYNYINSGNWCPKCAHIHEDKVLEIIKNKSGVVTKNFNYINANTRFKIKCKNNHIFNTNGSKLAFGTWCPYCKNKTQQEFRNVIENYFKQSFLSKKPKWLLFDKNNHKTRLELDGYCKELGIAFEYQGEQHYNSKHYYHICSPLGHKESWKKLKEHDAFKVKKCKEKGILLIVVPYWIPKEKWIIGIKNKYKKYKESLCQRL